MITSAHAWQLRSRSLTLLAFAPQGSGWCFVGLLAPLPCVRVQPHAIDMWLTRVQRKLPALITLVAIQSSLRHPLPGRARNLLDALNPGDSSVDVRITRKSDRQAAARNVKLSRNCLQNQHRAIFGQETS